MKTFFKSDFKHQNKKIYFFDLGANVGKVSSAMNDFFQKNSNDPMFFLIEPNPDNFHLIQKKFQNKKNFSFSNVAAWNKEEKMEFCIGKKNTATNSRLKVIIDDHKRCKKKYKKNVTVKTINTSSFIANNINQDNKNDIIVVKMDIEGSEYIVIDELIRSGVIKYIDYLLIEFHKVCGQYSETRNSAVYRSKLISANENLLIYQECSPGTYRKI